MLDKNQTIPPKKYGQKNNKKANKIFQSQTKVAPMIPNTGPNKGVNVMKSEIIKRIHSKKVLLIIKIIFNASATAEI